MSDLQRLQVRATEALAAQDAELVSTRGRLDALEAQVRASYALSVCDTHS